MTYCKKCARLTEGDVRVCPYCGAEEETADSGGNDAQYHDPFAESDSAIEKLRRIDEQIERNKPGSPDYVPNNAASEFVNPANITVEPDISRRAAGMPPEEKPSGGLYAGMVILSIFITLAGFIIGIVYMTHKSAAYRKMGLVVLLVSIGATLLWLVSCCAILYAIGVAMAPPTSF